MGRMYPVVSQRPLRLEDNIMYQAAYRTQGATTSHLTSQTHRCSSPQNSPLLAKAKRLLSNSPCRDQVLRRTASPSPQRSSPQLSSRGQSAGKCYQHTSNHSLYSSLHDTHSLVKNVTLLKICDENNVLQRLPYPDKIAAPANGQIRICTGLANQEPLSTPPQVPAVVENVEPKVNGRKPDCITCEELGDRLTMEGKGNTLLLDCRSFLSFNHCHISGAINVGCLDRLTKRRLQQGKMKFCDLIKCHMAKEQFNLNKCPQVVVYDDQTQEYMEDCGSPTPLVAVIQLLHKAEKKPVFLKGGLSEFHAKYKNLCLASKPPPDAPLYSPTTTIVSDEIDKAVASKILPFLYLGNERDIANLDLLRELGITHILNVTSNIQIHFEDQGIAYRRLPASDSGHQNLKQYFTEACDYIENVRTNGGRVMIHCQAGVSRSSTIVIAYLMCYSNLTMHQTYQFVKSKRSIVAPNFNFMGQLMELEQFLLEGKVERHSCPELQEALQADPSLIQEK